MSPSSRVIRRAASLLLLLAMVSGSAGCTLVKPVVGAVTAPALVLGETGLPNGCGCYDGCAVAGFFIGAAVVGAASGLVTGIISDVQVLTGTAPDPTRNWENPFAINTSEGW